MTEDEIQIEVMTWARIRARGSDGQPAEPRLHWLLHVPNGGLRSKRQAAKLKLMGVRAGVCDLLLPVPVGDHPGLWIELKTAKGRVSPEQVEFMAGMVALGWRAEVARSAQEAVSCLSGYLGMD